MNKSEIFLAIVPGWYFILRSYYLKGIIYFVGFSVVLYLSLFNVTFVPVSPLLFLVLIWTISIIDSLILHQQYTVNIESGKVIDMFFQGGKDSSVEVPFYFLQFYNATKHKDNNPSYFIKMIKSLNKKDLYSDWRNFVHYYANVNFLIK